MMGKGLTELVFILDRSGSMSGLEADTIGGFNSLIAKQKKEEGTALLDVLGGAIHHIGNVHKYAREEDRPEKTIFIITTDGMENSSHRYTYDKVKKMVERQRDRYGWEFLFLGANIDAIEVAGRFGVQANRAVNYECDGEGTQLNYEVLSKAVSRVRTCAAPTATMAFDECGDWAEEIRADYSKRHRGRR